MNLGPRNVLLKCIILPLVLVLYSCESFLEVAPPISKIPDTLVFSDDKAATAAICGLYIQLYSAPNFSYGGYNGLAVLMGLSADELKYNLNVNGPLLEFQQNRINSENSSVLDLWTSMYSTIYGCNAALEGLARSSTVTAQVKDHLRGEALFIRSFCYFYLVNLFGDVPLVSSTDYKTNSILGRSPVSEIYDFIKEDLTAAEPLLPEEYDKIGRMRINRSAVNALLSRIYLYTGDWGRAEDKASKVIARTNLYNLLSNINNVFLSNSSEAIWQLAPLDGVSSTNEGYFFSPEIAPNYNVLDSSILKSFEPNDKRTAVWTMKVGKLYVPRKYKNSAPNDSPPESSMVLRLAEQYLIRAEARVQQNKLTGEGGATSDINTIRSRAGLSPTAASTKEDLMLMIEQERKMEFLAEWGHRWLDLKRWHRANVELPLLKENWSPDDQLYPLPAKELRNSRNLEPQNSGY